MLGLILGLVGTGGVGLLAYLVGPAAMWSFIKEIPAWAYIAGAIIALIAFLTVSRGHFMDRAHQDEARIANFCNIVRIADHNPKLDCAKAEAQVELMGQALTATTKAIGDQNAAIARLAAQTVEEQQIAAKAQKAALQRASSAEAVAQRLDRSSRVAPQRSAPAGTCEPSPTLSEQWPR